MSVHRPVTQSPHYSGPYSDQELDSAPADSGSFSENFSVNSPTFGKTSSREGLSTAERVATLRFHDNALLQQILGDHDRHLVQLEQSLSVNLACRGNRIAISGPTEKVERAQTALTALYRKAEQGVKINSAQVDGVVRLLSVPALSPTPHQTAELVPPEQISERKKTRPTASSLLDGLPSIQTRRGVIEPRSHGQAAYMTELAQKELVFGIGPAGTGKTYLAVAQAVSMLLSGQIDRIVLSRPAVEAGERLGFLPGDMREKIDPYLRPLYDALHDMMPGEQITRRLGNGEIEVAPLAFMRGRTLANAYVILDEAQNTTPAQMKMFLTRMGPNTRMTITGDITQIDLPPGVTSGLKEALSVLADVPGLSICKMGAVDIVRHPLVARIVEAYEHVSPSSPPSRAVGAAHPTYPEKGKRRNYAS